MKLSINTDFTKLPRAGSFIREAELGEGAPRPFDTAVLSHVERHLRRRVVELAHGDKVMVDLLKPALLENGDVLVLDDGRRAEIVAAAEELYDVRASNPVHLAELAWHIGNLHLACEIEEDRILILRDRAVGEVLAELGATVREVSEPFQPLRSSHEGHEHGHRHGHGEADRYGRLPGDPHYGHDHA
jgi:urease accessory protein